VEGGAQPNYVSELCNFFVFPGHSYRSGGGAAAHLGQTPPHASAKPKTPKFFQEKHLDCPKEPRRILAKSLI
jgi:hypothetical protein